MIEEEKQDRYNRLPSISLCSVRQFFKTRARKGYVRSAYTHDEKVAKNPQHFFFNSFATLSIFNYPCNDLDSFSIQISFLDRLCATYIGMSFLLRFVLTAFISGVRSGKCFYSLQLARGLSCVPKHLLSSEVVQQRELHAQDE